MFAHQNRVREYPLFTFYTNEKRRYLGNVPTFDMSSVIFIWLYLHKRFESSVTRFGEISPLWQDFVKKKLRDLFYIRYKLERSLAKSGNWVNLHCNKWPNVGQIIEPSARTV